MSKTTFQTANKKIINPRSILHDLASIIDGQFDTDFEWQDVFSTFTLPSRYHVHSLLPLLENKVFTDKEGNTHDIHQVLKEIKFEYTLPPKKVYRVSKKVTKVSNADLEARIAQLELLVQQLTTN